MALEFSGNINLRNLDFVTYVTFAQAIRMFGKINGKEDNDITRNEFNLALDNNVLPIRYNQGTIDNIFKLIEDRDMPNQGLDILSYCFYDFILKMYHAEAPKGTYFLQSPHFAKIFQSQLMPFFVSREFAKIPQNNLTRSSYQMYTYLNVTNYQDESDHFLKSFVEKSSSKVNIKEREKTKAKNMATCATETMLKSRWSTLEAYQNETAFNFNAKQTFGYLFNVVDADMDGWITFLDFGEVMQVAYLFTHFDTYLKGRLPAGELYDKLSHYADFPVVSWRVRERAKMFNDFPQDLYVDLYSAILTIRSTEIFLSKVRRVDKSKVTEVELKHVLASVNRRHVPDAFLNRCLRGTTKDNIPLYDWECAFVQSEIGTLNFYESSFDRLTVKKQNINLTNTVFYNIAPELPQQGTIPNELKHSGYEIKY